MINRRLFLAAPALIAASSSSIASFARAEPSPNPGQCVITGFRGTRPSDPEVSQLLRMIENESIAGVILLGRNIASPEQLLELTTLLQSASPSLPVIVAVDQEGGQVSRLGQQNGFLPWESAAELAVSGRSDEEVFDYYFERSQEMAATGINLNLGPVVDLNVNPFNPIIGSVGRAFGRDVEVVVRFAELFINAHRSAGVMTCLKHFPGHGSSFSDSHEGSVDVSLTWSPEEIAPFERLVRAGLADSIMNSHVLHRYLSDEPFIPTSLSRISVTEIREGLGFKRPIITDDMQMGAVSDFMVPEKASVRALLVGNDLLIYSNFRERYSLQSTATVVEILKNALAAGDLTTEGTNTRTATVRSFRNEMLNSRLRRQK